VGSLVDRGGVLFARPPGAHGDLPGAILMRWVSAAIGIFFGPTRAAGRRLDQSWRYGGVKNWTERHGRTPYCWRRSMQKSKALLTARSCVLVVALEFLIMISRLPGSSTRCSTRVIAADRYPARGGSVPSSCAHDRPARRVAEFIGSWDRSSWSPAWQSFSSAPCRSTRTAPEEGRGAAGLYTVLRHPQYLGLGVRPWPVDPLPRFLILLSGS